MGCCVDACWSESSAKGCPGTRCVRPTSRPQYRTERGRVQKGSATGSPGLAYGPFDPAMAAGTLEHWTLNVLPGVLDDRRRTARIVGSHSAAMPTPSGEMEGSDTSRNRPSRSDLSGASQRSIYRARTQNFVPVTIPVAFAGKKVFQPSQLGKNRVVGHAGCARRGAVSSRAKCRLGHACRWQYGNRLGHGDAGADRWIGPFRRFSKTPPPPPTPCTSAA